ncbi:hypothetical protein LCGC14_2833470 [marine sediment metagenome]|uniref:Uncharacterized protein n=1 Tax=marine sediment metagenome TaxID=412755 RepID=A0A0F8YDD2_9ZZZZ
MMSYWKPDRYRNGDEPLLRKSLDDLIRDRFRVRTTAVNEVWVSEQRFLRDIVVMTVMLRRTAYDRIGKDRLPALARLLHASMVKMWKVNDPKPTWRVCIVCRDRPDVVTEESVPADLDYDSAKTEMVPIQVGRFRYLGD